MKKTKWRPYPKWFVTCKNKHQIRAQEVERFQVDMFILYFDQFFKIKIKMAARPEVVRHKKKTSRESEKKIFRHYRWLLKEWTFNQSVAGTLMEISGALTGSIDL